MPVFSGKRIVGNEISSSAELLKKFPDLEVHLYIRFSGPNKPRFLIRVIEG